MGVDRVQVLGFDHHRSPIALRERMAIANNELDAALADVCEITGIEGAVVLSTCNRSEFYYAGDLPRERMVAALAERQGVVDTELDQHCYHAQGPEAVRHLFRVGASLESMVVGEYQIMHQLRHAFDQARLHRAINPVLDRLFQRAIAAGKAVRNETAIGRYKLSMASIAVDLAEHLHGRLHKTGLLVIGAGEMAELAVKHFLERGVRDVTIVNRRRERALALSQQHGAKHQIRTRSWSELPEALNENDVVLASTAAPHAIITKELVEQVLANQRRRRRLMFIDLAVPRDVDPAVSTIDEAYVYNVDDLEQVVHSHRQLRDDEIVEAEQVIEHHVSETLRDADDDLKNLRASVADWFEDIVHSESERMNGKLKLSSDQLQTAAQSLDRVAGKLRHRVHAYISKHADEPDALNLIRELMGKQS